MGLSKMVNNTSISTQVMQRSRFNSMQPSCVYLQKLIISTLFCCFSVCLRIQINPQNKAEFLSTSPERAFADFLFAHTVLHLVVINFVGWGNAIINVIYMVRSGPAWKVCHMSTSRWENVGLVKEQLFLAAVTWQELAHSTTLN